MKGQKLTPKLKRFADAYLENGNATQSVVDAKYDVKNRNVARNMGTVNLAKPSVQAYLEDKAEHASEIVYEIAQFGESDIVRLNASKDILDRAGYKAVEKTLNVIVEVEALPEIKALTEKLNGIYRGDGVPSDGGESSVVGDKAQDKE